MKKRLLKSIVAFALSILTIFSAIGCGGSSVDSTDTSTLRIYICNQGYGRAWLDESLELFKEQDWVKEKYGEVKIAPIFENRDSKYASSQVALGPNGNKYDLLFSTTIDFKTVSENVNYFEDLTPLMDKTVPGENITVGEKMIDGIKDGAYTKDKNALDSEAKGKIYGMPWVDGYQGLLVNETLVKEKLGSKFTNFPRTTNELAEFSKLLADNSDIAPFVFTDGGNYWLASLTTWWAQYEGVENYYNYLEGYYNDERSYLIGNQKGKLYALQSLENLIRQELGYCHEYIMEDFITTQSYFYKREAFMMPNGDWVENEMADLISVSPAKDDKVVFMNMPIISNIIDKLDTVKDDATLGQLITLIDEGKTYEQAKATITNLTKKEYDKVVDARGIYEQENGSVAYVPTYAVSKDLAKDFLLFLSTDKAIETFITTTGGCLSPYEYDYSSLEGVNYSAMHQSVLNIKSNNSIPLKHYHSFPLYYYGGLMHFPSSTIPEIELYKNLPEGKTAQKIWEDDKVKLETSWSRYLENIGL